MLAAILEYIQSFSNLGFIPHGHCFLWRPELVYLNVTGDAIIGLSYYSIPITLIDFVRRRKDLPFNWIFVLFSGFILSCGSGHLADIWTLWYPDYWLTTGIKVITASVSIVTAISLMLLMPKAMALPSPAQLREANAQLEAEIIQRQKVQESLEKSEQLLAAYNLNLEFEVKERTAELEAATQAAKFANQAKSNFLANVSHELRTPLNAVIGFTELMITDRSLSTSHQQNLNIIKSSGEHLLSLINNVLNISRIEAGKDHIEISVVNLSDLLETVRAMMLLKAKSKNNKLVIAYSDNLPELVETDEKKLKQILINLVGNALKFTDQGQVKISASPLLQPLADVDPQAKADQLEQNFVLQFTVQDTGVGISEQELTHLFTSYNSGSSRSQDSTGLGLYISKNLVESLGGAIFVQSRLGHGTTFIFNLPVTVPSPSLYTPKPQQVVIKLAPNQPQIKILVVDDEYTNRQLLVKMLTDINLIVDEASNGNEAIDRCAHAYYDLVYMDLQMPITDGYEATRIIRSQHDQSQPKIIALTANVFADQQLITEIGCDDLLYKPFKSQEIFDILSKHLDLNLVCETMDLANIGSQLFKTDDFILNSLASLPPKLVTNLESAIHSADLDVLKCAIAEIWSQNSELADVIESYTKHFAYEQVLEAIAATKITDSV